MAPKWSSTEGLSRRDFLKLGALALGGLALRPFPPDDLATLPPLGRVTVSRLNVRREPAFAGERVGWRGRDEVVPLFEEVVSPSGPAHNPRWYRVWGGYIHSGYVQRVETRLNDPLREVDPAGQLAEVTVPFTQSYQPLGGGRWTSLYRLYYGSHHWITALLLGPDHRPWYEIIDDLLKIRYAAPARHLRPVPPSEWAPLSPEVPAGQKRLEVDLAAQTVTAFESDRPVFHTQISSGRPSSGPSPTGIPTDTPVGKHIIDHKRPVRHMGNGEVTSNPAAYELPGVPWVSYFYSLTGVAFHGTYWHDNFGTPMSHGCVNMRTEEAKWLFRWSTPGYVDAGAWYQLGRGTLVHVFGVSATS